MTRRYFFDLDLNELKGYFAAEGVKPFRAGQLMHRVYLLGTHDPALMTEFSAEVRARLAADFDFSLPEPVESRKSSDGTVKLLLRLADGQEVETVLIPDEERLTQCISTQAGCAMGCAFCRTASGGLARHLTSGEMAGQVLSGEKHGGFNRRVTNIVFMGMGEPLHNLDNTVKAFDLFTSAWGFGLGRRRITVSTCGLVEEIGKLPERMLPSLAVSLNATTDAQRSAIMPVNRRYPLAELVGALSRLKWPSRERLTIEYVLLGGLNDTPADAKRLVRLLSGVRCKINLIPYNPHGESEFSAPSPDAVEAFQGYLLDHGLVAVKRASRGADILAACGQLKAEKTQEPRRR